MRQSVSYQTLEWPRVVLVCIFLLVAVWYLSWRPSVFNPDAPIFSLALYCAELYGFGTILMHLFMTWRLLDREAPPAPEGLSVDVFVTTINEPVNILRRTLLHAMAMDYPHQTWLLDDGRRPEMAALAKELGCKYLGRPDNTDAKAGNLNHALAHSNGNFIATFDADHAPGKNFLRRTLGYFQDDSVAFVQTPQDFYNLDSFQHHKPDNNALAWHEQSVFFRVIQRGKDYWNAAFFCGSCAVLRRSALDSIGGFATGTVTEDLHTSVRLHKQGFQSVYHAESLAFGLAPASIVPFLKQRIRWGQGATQIWRKEGVLFCRGLTMPQRINYLASSITYFDGWQKAFFYITPVIVLTTGIMPLQALGPDFLFHFVPYFLLSFWVFEEVNRGYGRTLATEQFNMVRFAAMAWSTLAFFKGKLHFAVTPKGAPSSSNTLMHTAPQRIVLTLNLLAIPAGAVLYLSYSHIPLEGLIACTVWASVNLLFAGSVLLFSKVKSQFKRMEYRFPIPLPAKLILSNSVSTQIYGTVDDISATGFRFYASFPGSVMPGNVVAGEIFLPTGPLRIQAEVKALIPGSTKNELYVKAIGCSFVWEGTQEEDKLNLFLYGSDIHRRMNDLRETIRTPLERFNDATSSARRDANTQLAHWAAMTLNENEQSESTVGLISVSNGAVATGQILVFKPLAENARIKLNIHSRSNTLELSGKVRMSRRMDVSAFSIFCYYLIPDNTKIPQSDKSRSSKSLMPQ